MRRWLRPILGNLCLALGVLNALLAAANLGVLTWLARRRVDLLASLGAVLVGRRLAARTRWWLLPLAVPLQLALASLRGLFEHPLRRMQPDGLRCERVDLPCDDGSLIPGLWLEPDAPAVGGVVVCHGAGAHKTYYMWRLVEQLLAQDLAVLTIDLDGHGENQRTFDVPAVTTDVAVAVAALRQRHAHVGVIGHSLGGCVAGRAVADGLAVPALAIMASPLHLELDKLPYTLPELRGLLRPAFWRVDDRATPWQLWRMWATPPVRSRLGLTAMIDQLNLTESLPRIACPTLLLYGTGDIIAPYAPLLPLLPSIAHASLYLYGGASHLSLPMEEPPLHDVAVWMRAQLTRMA